jgi:hypothetical protein
VQVPSLSPFLGILIDLVEEKVVEEPDVSGEGGIQVVIDLEIDEENLPLVAEAVGDVIPEALNASVVDAPALWWSGD